MYKLICEVSNVETLETLPVSGVEDTLYAIRKPNMVEPKHEVKVESLYLWDTEKVNWNYLCDRLIYTNDRADIIDSPVYYTEGMQLSEDVLYMVKTKYDRSTDPDYTDIVDMIVLKVLKNGILTDLNNMLLFSDAEPVHIPVINDISVDDAGEFTALEVIGDFIPDPTTTQWTVTFDEEDGVWLETVGTILTLDAENTAKFRAAYHVSVEVEIGVASYAKVVKDEPVPTVINNITADDTDTNVVLTIDGTGIKSSTPTTWNIKIDDNEAVVIEGTGLTLTLGTEMSSNYKNGYHVVASVTANEVTSDEFVVKDVPVPIPVDITNITADDSGDNVILSLTATGISEDTEVNYTLYVDEGDGIAVSGTGLSVTLDNAVSEAYRNGGNVSVQATVGEYTSEVFTLKSAPVPVPVSITDVTADDSGLLVTLTMESTGIEETDPAYWTITFDQEDGIAVEGLGTTLELDSEMSESYKNANTVKVQITVDEYVSDEFTVKEAPVPEPTVITDITADDSGEQVVLTMTATGVTEEDEAQWTVTIDDQDGIAVSGTGLSVTLSPEVTAQYNAGNTVKVQVTVNDVTSDEYTVKDIPVPEPTIITGITADDTGDQVVLTMEATGVAEDDEVQWTVTIDEQDGIAVPGVGTSVTLSQEVSTAYKAGTTVKAQVTVNDVTSYEYTVKEPGPVPVEVTVTNITADDSGENVVLNLEGTGIEEDTEVEYHVTFFDGEEDTQVTLNGTGSSLTFDQTNSEAYVNSMTTEVFVAIGEYVSSIFTVKEPKVEDGASEVEEEVDE